MRGSKDGTCRAITITSSSKKSRYRRDPVPGDRSQRWRLRAPRPRRYGERHRLQPRSRPAGPPVCCRRLQLAPRCRPRRRRRRPLTERRRRGGNPQRCRSPDPARRRDPRPRSDRALGGARHRPCRAGEGGRVGLGTPAPPTTEMVREAAADHPGRIVVGIDARDGFAAIEGWIETTELGVVEVGRRYADCGVAGIVYTDIARDGALCGIDAKAVAGVARQIRLPVIASGGVASLDDIAALKACEADGIAGVICGRALYDGRIDPAAALRLLSEKAPC